MINNVWSADFTCAFARHSLTLCTLYTQSRSVEKFATSTSVYFKNILKTLDKKFPIVGPAIHWVKSCLVSNDKHIYTLMVSHTVVSSA